MWQLINKCLTHCMQLLDRSVFYALCSVNKYLLHALRAFQGQGRRTNGGASDRAEEKPRREEKPLANGARAKGPAEPRWKPPRDATNGQRETQEEKTRKDYAAGYDCDMEILYVLTTKNLPS